MTYWGVSRYATCVRGVVGEETKKGQKLSRVKLAIFARTTHVEIGP